jgi:hypothetical protein
LRTCMRSGGSLLKTGGLASLRRCGGSSDPRRLDQAWGPSRPRGRGAARRFPPAASRSSAGPGLSFLGHRSRNSSRRRDCPAKPLHTGEGLGKTACAPPGGRVEWRPYRQSAPARPEPPGAWRRGLRPSTRPAGYLSPAAATSRVASTTPLQEEEGEHA